MILSDIKVNQWYFNNGRLHVAFLRINLFAVDSVQKRSINSREIFHASKILCAETPPFRKLILWEKRPLFAAC